MDIYEMHPMGAKGFGDKPLPPERQWQDEDVRIDASGVATGTESDAIDMARLGRKQERLYCIERTKHKHIC